MSIPPGLQVYFMGFMPYSDLPADHHRYPSMWVDYPNRLYDPVKGHALYNRYLSEYVLADQARLRRPRRQRAPLDGLQHDARRAR